MKKEMQNCLDTCYACMIACNKCEAACLQEANVKDLTQCIQLDKECSLMCGVTIHSITHNSSFSLAIMKLCAEICDACATECEKHDDVHCKECAVACRKCAEECKEMA